jgi:hypothetical protein
MKDQPRPVKQQKTAARTDRSTRMASPPPSCRHCGKLRAEHMYPATGRYCREPHLPLPFKFQPGPSYDELLRVIAQLTKKVAVGRRYKQRLAFAKAQLADLGGTDP